ncbi:MAG: hypothetical protein ACKOEE_14725 [Tagaea sp.]
MPPAHAQTLADALHAAGARADLRVYPDIAHIDMVLGLSSRLRGVSPLIADIATFVRGRHQPVFSPMDQQNGWRIRPRERRRLGRVGRRRGTERRIDGPTA